MMGLTTQFLVFCLFFFFSHLCATYSLSFQNSSSSIHHLCSPEESLALLHFKHSFSIDNSSVSDFCLDGFGYNPSYPKTESWKEGTDCCKWDGVTCDRWTSSVIGLDLTSSWLVGTFHDNSSLFLLHSLQTLNLSCNDFRQSEMSSTFCGFSKLRHLNFSSSNFSGLFPTAISHLSNLVSIDLSGNKLLLTSTATVNITVPSLKYFYCGSCNLTEIPLFLIAAKKLTGLFLPNNRISGQISLTDSEAWQHLRILDLSQNFLTSFKMNISLTNLSILYLSSNELQGALMDPPLRLSKFSVSHNKLTGGVPPSFCNLSSIKFVNLSDNSLSGPIPQCFGNYNKLVVLDLGMNSFHSRIPQTFSNASRLHILDLNGNQLDGPLPRSLVNCSSLLFLDIGNNTVNDTFPHWLERLPHLRVLIFRLNRFHGIITNMQTRFPYPSLERVDISHNYFAGEVPSSFSKGKLLTLALSHNQLEGPLPRSLANCSALEVLDVGNNKISDTFPQWLEKLPELKVLILRANKFHGPIRKSPTRFPFSNLRIIDISNNRFIGLLPTVLFQNFHAMTHGDNNSVKVEYMRHYCGYGYYHDSVSLSVKGVDIQMERILNMLTTIDMSNNQFEGSILEVVGNLNSLKWLNFSHNHLTGHILQSLENLTQLESLDLSSNKLTGEIPLQLASLTYLAVLNVSHNKLVGHIPQGSQIQTFDNNSFIGNSGLCGFPLTKECGNDAPESEPSTSTSSNEANNDTCYWFWKIIMMGYGSGLVIGMSTAYMVFTAGKPVWIMKISERLKQPCKKVRMLRERHKGGSK